MKTDYTELSQRIEDNKKLQRHTETAHHSYDLKYVIVNLEGMERAIVFPNEIAHIDILRACARSYKQGVSAGFVEISYEKDGPSIGVHGESESIKNMFEQYNIHKSRGKIDQDIIYASYVRGCWDYFWPFVEEGDDG